MIDKYVDLLSAMYNLYWGAPVMITISIIAVATLGYLFYRMGQVRAGGIRLDEDETSALLGFALVLAPILCFVFPLAVWLAPIWIPTVIFFRIQYKIGVASVEKEKKKRAAINLKKEREENAAYQRFLEEEEIKKQLGEDYLDPTI